ncbi:MAG: hypothetical protein QOD49_1883 [Actinomycetota bacterium]|nr:hypothetical protein [Actinomycetota bacterium]
MTGSRRLLGFRSRLPEALRPRLPRLFHYCWVGGKEPDQFMKDCLRSWRVHSPKFELMRWDESNLPSDPFIDRALEAGQWSRASNAIRLHALNRYGGIYLDTDVEMLQSFEPLRRFPCFLGFQYVPDGTYYRPFEMCVAPGVMGATAGHPYLQRFLAKIPRDVQGPEAFSVLGPQMATSVLIEDGLTGYSDIAVDIGGVTIFPKNTFYPYFYQETFDRRSLGPSSLSVHHWAKRW